MIKLKQLIKESDEHPVNGAHELVWSGLTKVFSNDAFKISYKQIEAVGLGYIKDVSEAQRVALQAARELAPKHGYVEDENNRTFVKSSGGVSEVSFGSSVKHGSPEKDAVLDYLKMISQMPDDEPPPLHVWELVVKNANVALQHYIRNRGWSGLNEVSFGDEESSESEPDLQLLTWAKNRLAREGNRLNRDTLERVIKMIEQEQGIQ